MTHSLNDLGPSAWQKSSYSNATGGHCVEVVTGIVQVVPVRDSKDTGRPPLLFPTTGWSRFVTLVKDGRFDG